MAIPTYIAGTACIVLGLNSFLRPAHEYPRFGLPLESSLPLDPSPTPGSQAQPKGLVSPLIYIKALRESTYGLALIALQHQGLEKAVTTMLVIMALAGLGDGFLVWKYGGDGLKTKALGHWATFVGLLGIGMDDDSFFLYGIGEKPDALTLGSLVLEKYWIPLIARHYTHEPLRGEHLEAHAWSSKLTNLVLHGRTRLTPGIGVSGFDIVDLRLAWNKDQERYVTAKSGQKITLKDPEKFLTTQVLSNPQARATLKLWLSSARSDYVMNMRWARRPKIWFLTGLYLLSDARTIVRKSSSSSIDVGLSSAIVGALSGVPVGGSVSLGQGDTWEMTLGMEEEHVWAAQYRLIDAKYISASSSSARRSEGLALPPTMSLYKDILSMRNKRTTSQIARDAVDVDVELGLEPFDAVPVAVTGPAPVIDAVPMDRTADVITLVPEEEEAADAGEEEDEESFEEYEKRLEEAIRMFEAAPPRFLER
ncbi:Protein of unknown function DUF4267 [Penicillium occitanis (nom. inval.)]|nr:Protein of unknown function DUF4267 [Penicillium occitanis (nom. inval.)]PCH00566.1 hypothetical protein PENOC_052360 [Penicillium occitanis (nom. inval.)]